MRTALNFLGTAARLSIGFILVAVAVAAATAAARHGVTGSVADAAGQLIASLIIALIFGTVGVKMITRQPTPRERS